MKPMTEKKMDMKKGEPDSEGFFPEMPHTHKMNRPGEIKGFKYPDTEEAVHRDQEQFVKETSANMPKTGFRH
ncbi:hypothetical protein UFOVP80_30 [uncultured Caudovirales phage]|jgi:hypothetical protein|uniref:Uncharacterized protein n=1 Tax=uncultured Caudovirales phage TaxID=2100421 RepID=A0A6J5L251_9CAUD|nr:hypothetical protein UFOVP80_30 [uncultured Caudovirales phage]